MKNCCTPSDCSPNDLTARKTAWFLWYVPIAFWWLAHRGHGARMGVGARPRGDGAWLPGERSPLRAVVLLGHWAAVPRGGALRRALGIWAGRLAPRPVSHRRADGLMPCPVCGDSVGEVPEENRSAFKLPPCSEPDNKGQQNSWPRWTR